MALRFHHRALANVLRTPPCLCTSTLATTSNALRHWSGARALGMTGRGGVSKAKSASSPLLAPLRPRLHHAQPPVGVMVAGGHCCLMIAGVSAARPRDAASAQSLQRQPSLDHIIQKEVQQQQLEREEQVSQQQQRPPEWYVILMGCTGALIGYATAIAFKWTGRYLLYFVAVETAALLVLRAARVITTETALGVAKFTMPPFAWTLRTAVNLVRGEFRKVFSASSLALRFFFVLSFGLTLRYSKAGQPPSWI